ncbi:Sb-PDE family phosphodiesterase [Actomonas aquatica]|uniref:Sb-PDE family phosphodiesterase n=1 Tax=Actomonas aquatica TaxID=2866162 RepID=A0ABZ1CD78_9BACT|nr:Sb-PDE family phosphodiesterase [Opitutus sp. WL0086]WRQ89638.1 Sb-PDE family phosphodiesterase [Opitutus sp. WL0086]
MTADRLLRAALFFALTTTGLLAHDDEAHHWDEPFDFPDLPGYLTLVSDLHQHSVFSDGAVWPTIRVQESKRDGIEVMALTEHLEYQPHAADIPHPDRNRSFHLAHDHAQDDLLVVTGAEVTRSMPPGHINAIFIEDANRLIMDDPMAVAQEATRQGGFLFWNHPMWLPQKPDGVSELTPLHEQMIAAKVLHGIEVVNHGRYSEEALQIALDHDLTIMGTSDVHGLIAWEYETYPHLHRPVTLIFAEAQTAPAVREALFDHRTVVWYTDTLIGRQRWVEPLTRACLDIAPVGYPNDHLALKVVVSNSSSTPFTLRNRSAYALHRTADIFRVPAHGQITLEFKTREKLEAVDLSFEVLNAIIAPATHPTLTWEKLTVGTDASAAAEH